MVNERVVLRKSTVTEHYQVEADLIRERVEIDADLQFADRVHDDGNQTPRLGDA